MFPSLLLPETWNRERGEEKIDRQALDGLMSVPSPPRHLSPDPASPVRRWLFPPSPSSPFLSLYKKINKWDDQVCFRTYVLRVVEIICTVHLIASWTEAVIWKAGWCGGEDITWERGNKQDAGASKLRQKQIAGRYGLSICLLSLKKEGGKTPGTDPRSPKNRKKMETRWIQKLFQTVSTDRQTHRVAFPATFLLLPSPQASPLTEEPTCQSF